MRKRARDGDLRKIFKTNLKTFFWVPVETWAVTGPGVPDSWYQAPGGPSGWVEFKRHPNRVSPEQGAFASRVSRMGGRVLVAVRVGDDELRLYLGSDAPALAAGGTYAAEPVLVTRGPPAWWDWSRVGDVLLGRRAVGDDKCV